LIVKGWDIKRRDGIPVDKNEKALSGGARSKAQFVKKDVKI